MTSWLLSASVALLSACNTTPENPLSSQRCSLKQAKINYLTTAPWPAHFSVDRVLAMVQKSESQEASRYIQLALQISPNNALLHLINGFVFEEMIKAGDDSRKELILMAYQSACNLDPSLWAARYFLGLAQLREERLVDAQQSFSDAFILHPNSAEVAYALAYTSYYLRQLDIATMAILKAVNCDPKNPMYTRGAALIFAASHNVGKSNYYFSRYKAQVSPQEPDIHVVQRRLMQWRAMHEKNSLQKMASDFGGGPIDVKTISKTVHDDKFAAGTAGAGLTQLPTLSDADNEVDKPMIQIDCVLLRYNKNQTSMKGNNILDALSLNLQNASYSKINTQNWVPTFSSSQVVTKTFNIALQAIPYALNIANAIEQTLELCARPTINTMVGLRATFSQGDQYVGASISPNSSASASLLNVESGTTVQVEPSSLTDDGLLTINILLKSIYFVTDPLLNVGAGNQLFRVSRANVNTTVKVRLGETIMLAGMYDTSRSRVKSGVPFLQDIPLLQYFFSSEQTSDNNNSLLYLMTPRIRGSSPLAKKYAQTCRQKLQQRGLMNPCSNDRVIFKNLEKSPMFQNFSSGDLPKPYWGGDHWSFEDKMKNLQSYIYF